MTSEKRVTVHTVYLKIFGGPMNKKEFIDELYEEVSRKEKKLADAVQEIAICIQTDYRLFGIAKYDEDIRSSIVLDFIKTGYRVFERYDRTYGSFHNYVISFVKGIAQTQAKFFAISAIHSKVNFLNGIDMFPAEAEKHDFTLNVFDSIKVPYAQKNKPFTLQPVKLKDFMAKRISDPTAKVSVILALKACYDVSDYEIQLLCNQYNLDEEDFYSAVQEMKDSLSEKYKYRKAYENSINAAYFNHRKYSPEFISQSNPSEPMRNLYKTRYENSTRLWKKRSLALKRGRFHFSPTNKKLAQRLGICERQVGYYITKARTQYGEGIEGLEENCTGN